jgi:parallel beta-helix repeat protein
MTSAVAVANNTFRDNWYGIFVWFSSGNQINENLLSRNNIGIYLNNASYVNLINGNNISSNQEYGVYSEINVNATSNYWGNPSGPYNQMHNPSGMGDKVSDNVDFQHWIGFNPGKASEYVETESKPLIPLDWRTGLLVSIFAITNYTVSQWIVKWARVPVDRIAKWVTDKEKKKK